MTNGIINLTGVSKRYAIYHHPTDRLKELLFRKYYSDEVWALRDISFSVGKGEAFGIAGENGAGKSTLLSIIAGITKQTSGSVDISGRVSSLLELGVGFHQEFTGIQNIYLYGTMLGLSRQEMNKKLNSIIDFSELGDSINRPIKTYSTGMVVRLAFSVAIAIEPEILIIDEALSVGDIHFQKKSLDAIMEFKKRGGTILFCSHSMYHILHLCDRALWLKNGRAMKLGEAYGVVEAYENYIREKNSKENEFDQTPVISDSPVWIKKATIKKDGREVNFINTGDPVDLDIHIGCKETAHIHLAIGLDRNDTVNIYATSTEMAELEPILISGTKHVCFSVQNLNLLPGEYNFVVILMDDKAFNVLHKYRTKNFSVIRKTKELGVYKIKHLWKIGDQV